MAYMPQEDEPDKTVLPWESEDLVCDNYAYADDEDVPPQARVTTDPPPYPYTDPRIVPPAEIELRSKRVEEVRNKSIDAAEDDDEEEENARGHWGNHIEFILSCIGYAVGLGNVWRFPYQCYKNGGGCFLVVYWILSACVGFPLVFFEQSLGQYTSQGPISCWKYAPIIRGIGFAMVAMSSLACIYYNVIISWSIFMLFGSFQHPLPFASCDFNSWADYRCELQMCQLNSTLIPEQMLGVDGLCYNTSYLQPPPLDISLNLSAIPDTSIYTLTACPNTSSHYVYAATGLSNYCVEFVSTGAAKTFRNTSTVLGFWDEELAHKHRVDPQLSTDQYFHHHVLRLYDEHSTDNLGTPSWGLALCLLLAWIIVFLCLLNGIHSSGKVVYFSAIFPYVILVILIGRGVTLPGAWKGIKFFLQPDFQKLKDPQLWFAAANQLFYSMGGTWGGMIALSSYNKFNNNVVRDPLISAFMDSFTSFIAGFAIFSIIGYGSELLGKPVDQVATAGTGLAFVMYPKILMELPGSVAWAIAFFLMLLFLGLDSEFNMMETVLTALLDFFPYFRVNRKRKACFVGGLCIFFYLCGLPMICNGGSYLTTAVDLYSSSFGAFCIGIIELLSISWLYGSGNYFQDIKLMLGSFWNRPGYYYIRIFWGIISPGIILTILIYSIIVYKPLGTFHTDEIIGWMCAAFVIIWIPTLAIYEVIMAKSGGSFLQRLRCACSPAKEWGPYMVRDRRLVTHLGPDFDIDPYNKLKKNKRKNKKNKDNSSGGSTGVFTTRASSAKYNEAYTNANDSADEDATMSYYL